AREQINDRALFLCECCLGEKNLCRAGVVGQVIACCYDTLDVPHNGRRTISDLTQIAILELRADNHVSQLGRIIAECTVVAKERSKTKYEAILYRCKDELRVFVEMLLHKCHGGQELPMISVRSNARYMHRDLDTSAYSKYEGDGHSPPAFGHRPQRPRDNRRIQRRHDMNKIIRALVPIDQR